MEIMATTASTNSHNQKELRLFVPPMEQTSSSSATTLMATNGARSPFQREVREWQRIDPDTGALLTGRLEADRWINGPLNSYGKISDSQNISQPNGTQQTQRKQLEVIQTCTAGGGAMQVIRSQTVQTTSSRWSTTSSSSATASPSPPSLLQQQKQLATETSTASKDKYLKTNKETTHKRTTNSTSSFTNTSASSSSSSFIAPTLPTNNGFHHHRNNHPHHHTKFQPITTSTKTTRTCQANHRTPSAFRRPQPQPGHNLVNGHNNGKRNWPQIVTENMSSTLDICDNDHDNEHVHDNDYIVEQLSDDCGNDVNAHANAVDDDNDVAAADDAVDNNHSNNNTNGSLLDVEHQFLYNDDDGHDDDNNSYLLNKSSSFSNKHPATFTLYANSDNGATTIKSCNNDDELHHHQQQHLLHDLRNGHSSSSCSSLNSHSGNSCSNSNQLFLLDTAPSLKLSNLMKSSSSISNSSNNSTTASSNLNTNVNINSSMNTHSTSISSNSKASKISLHAIVGNNSNTSEHTATTTTKAVSSTPSPMAATTTATVSALTATTSRPSWQQPTLFRQNSNSKSPISNTSQSTTKLKHTHSSSSSNPSHHLAKSRVGDNNCCGGGGGGSSSDESRPYADLRHHHQQSQHRQHQYQQRHHSPQRRPSPAFQLKQQNDRLTPTQSSTPRQQQQQHLQQHYNRVDLESFRHYNNNDTYDAADDDDGLRLSSRQLRRQQVPTPSSSFSTTTTTPLQRSRSISTDDLSTEWDINGADDEEPAEWRRVSKLRRSFQSSTKSPQPTAVSSRRPLDLPANSVSVSKIRAELENGRRLNTVMKNNHVDMAALSSILNMTEKDSKYSPTPKHNSFLTAASLKEIRGKLKKLSDESLYKEDFIINHHAAAPLPEHETIEVQPSRLPRSLERSPERQRVQSVQRDASPLTNAKHTTNSLESRLKYKEANSSEWHLRRKSYGFEKMSPPDKSMLRMDASTDSGLGRSGELQNWSPTSEGVTAGNRNSTVVHFSDNKNRAAAVHRRYRPQTSYEESENSPEEDLAVNKRHSIAVDESQYVRDNGRQTTQVRLNVLYDQNNEGKFIQTTETSTTTGFSQRGQQKRVEFCKTEVHFATESGRVNIVETDSKPPPTNNFRRRRSRSSSVGPLQSLVKSATTVSTTTSSLASSTATVAMPVTLFGDDSLRRKTIASTTVAYRAPLVCSPEPLETLKNVTVSLPESYGHSESSRSSYASTSGVDTTDYETDEMTSLRGILKNKPAKPKPYVLGENIEKPDDLWGIQLKPVQAKSDSLGRVQSDSPTFSAVTSSSSTSQSVADRIRLVEKQHDYSAVSPQSNGFSTKINLGLGQDSNAVPSAKNWEETGQQIATLRRPSAQELLMQSLKEHQRILDEGLKSTTLIMKTMRSATEFDEAMRRLSVASVESASLVQPTPMLRSNSYQESTQSHDFDELFEPPAGNLQLYKSTSFSSTSSWSTLSSRKMSTDSRKTSTDSGASFARKDSMPRLSFLGNEDIPVSQQLHRLRLMYDAATVSQEAEDSADEEVKSYFRGHGDSDSGGGTQESSSYEDDYYLENTNSWSRLKAKKTIWKIDTDNSVESLRRTMEKTELPISNVMSIKLHSPQAAAETAATLKVMPPVAKPRTVTKIPENQTQNPHATTKQPGFQTSLPTKDSLKIIKEARGARQLREHELSYFGISELQSEHDQLKTKLYPNSTRNSPKRSLPLRRLSEETSVNDTKSAREDETHTKWQLEHDKPDLLKHNPIVQERRKISIKPAERISLKKKAELDLDEEHLYENIANELTPIFKVKDVYDRKMDLKRDAMILSEMNENADQTLRELSDEAALKDRKRRSLQRRNSKPLETIDEKAIAEKINDTCIAVKVARGTFASDAKKTSRHSTPSPTRVKPRERTSSQSSVECCPRARSRSLSSEKEYENNKAPIKPSRSTQVKHKSQKAQTQSRSSSLDSQRSYHSHYSSGEEQQLRNSFRREDRSRTKTKRISNSNSSSLRSDKHKEDKPSNSESKRSSSTTRSSAHKERVECLKDNATIPTTPSQQSKSPHQPRSATSLQRSNPVTSSGRRLHKDDTRDSQRMKRTSTTAAGKSATERHERQESSTKHVTSRSNREDERNNSARSSSHRLERGDKDKEKLAKSKVHSSRSTSQQHQHHHERSTTANSGQEKLANSKDSKTKSSTSSAADNTTRSKNVQQHQHNHQQHRSHSKSKERKHQDRQHRNSKLDETPAIVHGKTSTTTQEHVYGLKSAIIKSTTKLREKSRLRKDKK